ncbi:hypothetical protein ACUH95_09150, partial [Dermabacteraceae bacterium P13101]
DDVVRAAEEYLAPLKEACVAPLILGCTHYPLLKGPISYVMGESVSLVSSSDESALEVYRILRERGMERTDPTPPRHVFSETAVHDGDAPTRFELLSERFLGPRLTKTTTLPVAFPPPEPHETSAPTP